MIAQYTDIQYGILLNDIHYPIKIYPVRQYESLGSN
jgi:hypothetical protein